MPDIDPGSLVNEMLKAASGVLKDRWPDVKGYAEMEFKKSAETIAAIQRMRLVGEITEEQARLLMEMQKHAMRNVMTAVEIMSIVAAEQAINAAIGAVRKTVNTALGFALL